MYLFIPVISTKCLLITNTSWSIWLWNYSFFSPSHHLYFVCYVFSPPSFLSLPLTICSACGASLMTQNTVSIVVRIKIVTRVVCSEMTHYTTKEIRRMQSYRKWKRKKSGKKWLCHFSRIQRVHRDIKLHSSSTKLQMCANNARQYNDY